MYVPGTLSNTDSVLIDIGTGYYVTKVQMTSEYLINEEKRKMFMLPFFQTVAEAKEFADRKIKLIGDKIDEVNQALAIKRRNYELILRAMQMKVAEYESMQKQQKQEIKKRRNHITTI